MLKIKDNIDLKELEKFGWEFACRDCLNYCDYENVADNKNCWVIKEQRYCKFCGNYTTAFVDNVHREIFVDFDDGGTFNGSIEKLEPIQDLIKADMVVKDE